MEEKTAPIILLFGTVQLTAFTLCYEVLELVLTDAFLPGNPSITKYWYVPDSKRGFATDAALAFEYPHRTSLTSSSTYGILASR